MLKFLITLLLLFFLANPLVEWLNFKNDLKPSSFVVDHLVDRSELAVLLCGGDHANVAPRPLTSCSRT